MNNILSYKSKIASRYFPVDAEQIGLKIAESDYYLASVKYDGHLAFITVNKGKAELLDRNGDVLNVPAITNAAKNIKDHVVLVGELCCYANDRSTTHREVSAALAKPDKNDLRLAVFDIIEYNGEPVNDDPKTKIETLTKILSKGKEIFAIEQKLFESRKDLIAFYKESTDQNAEGIVVRSANGIVYKVKAVHHLDLVVLGYAESTGERDGWLRELLLGFALGDDQYQIITKCGGGFSDNDRQEMPSELEKMAVPTEYTEVSGAKTAFVMVKPEMVIEISCLDLINETSSGAIRKATLRFDKKKGYLNEGNHNTLSIISPNFVRIRKDKKANEQDAGTQQAYNLTEPLNEKNSKEKGAESTIVFREVYTKGGKGGTAVRKFIGLKTNKDTTGVYSPYVAVYTDYSGGRKTPLEQEIFLCSNEKDLHAKIDLLKEENIKKGWELIK
jgi:ATP-dependent DNA ligase